MTQTAMDVGHQELPAGWKRVNLEDICQITLGQSPPGSTYRNTPDGLPFFQGKADFGEIHPTITTWCVKPNKIAEPGDILISVRAPVGPTNLADTKCCIGRGLAALRCKPSADTHFVLSALKLFETSISSMGAGSTFSAITGKQLRTLRLPLPTLEEQKRIAAILNEQMAAVENAKKGAEERFEAATALPVAYLKEVFQGKESESWSEVRFGDIVTNHDGKRIPVKQSDRRQMSGEFPYYGASGIIDYVDDYLFEGQYLLIGEDGANLLLRSSQIAFLADGKFWVNNHAHVLTANSPFNNRLLAYAIESMDLSPYVAGSAQPKLTQRNLNNILLRLPQNSDQIEQLTSKIENYITGAGLVSDSIQQQLETVEAMPAALLRKAFSGEL